MNLGELVDDTRNQARASSNSHKKSNSLMQMQTVDNQNLLDSVDQPFTDQPDYAINGDQNGFGPD